MPIVDGNIDPEQLHRLAESGDLEQLNNYIFNNTTKEDFNRSLDGDGYDNGYALRYVAWFGHLDVLNELLKIEQVRKAITSVNNYALRYAKANGHLDVVNKLCEFPEVTNYSDSYVPPPSDYDSFSSLDINIDSNKLLALAKAGDLGVLNWYIYKNSTDPDFTKKHYEVEGFGNSYALRYVAAHGHLEVLNALLENPLVQKSAAAINNYALRRAAACGHLSIIQRLLECENVVKDNDQHLLDVLEWSIFGGQYQVLNWVLDKVNYPNMKEGITVASWKQKLDIALSYISIYTKERKKKVILCLLQVMADKGENISRVQFFKLIALQDLEIISLTVQSPLAPQFVFTNLLGDNKVKFLKDVATLGALKLPEDVNEKIMSSLLPTEFSLDAARKTLRKYRDSNRNEANGLEYELSIYEEMLPKIVKLCQHIIVENAFINPIVTKYSEMNRKKRTEGLRNKASIISCDDFLKLHGFDPDHLTLANAKGEIAIDVARASDLADIIREIEKRIRTQSKIGKNRKGLGTQ